MECAKVLPKIFFIVHKFHNRNFIAFDILTSQLLQVIVSDPTAKTPKQGEIAAGILLHLGGNLHIPIVDFYHFDYRAREALASCLREHFYSYSKNSSPQETYLHVLSIMLQIEKTIPLEKQKNQLTSCIEIQSLERMIIYVY